MNEDKAFRQRIARIEGLIAALDTFGDPSARATAEELVQAIMELHGIGLERLLDLTWEKGAAGRAIIDDFAADDLVSSLLLLHGLHPLGLQTRVARALDKVRPYLGTHGGDVELLDASDGVVRLRLQGTCHGCPSSAMTLKGAIETAVRELAPDIERLEVEGVIEEWPGLAPSAAFISIDQIAAPGPCLPVGQG